MRPALRLRRGPEKPALFALVATLAGASLAGCAGASPRPSTLTELRPGVREVNYATYADARRELDEHGHLPAYRPLRDGVARHAARLGVARLQEGDTDGAVEALRAATEHYAPDELARGGLPSELVPLARGLLDAVSPRGDESRALATNRILALTDPRDDEATARFALVHEWGERNRREFRLPWVYRGEMAEIYSEVARLVPATDVLDRAAELIADRRRAAIEARGAQAPARDRRITREDIQQLQAGLTASPMSMAVLYLRVSDLEAAAQHVSLLAGEGAQSGLAGALRSVANGEGGADSLGELATRIEPVDRAASVGVCRVGRRLFPNDSRFAQCLGLAAARDRDFGLASAHLAVAHALAPNDRSVARASLSAAAQWLEGELDADEPTAGRRATERVRSILRGWNATANGAAPVRESEVDLLAARVEVTHGNLTVARDQLERVAASTPPVRDAFLTLGEIAWRKGDARRAMDAFERGLRVPLGPTESDSTFRPIFQLRLGLAARAAGDGPAAERALTQAEASFAALGRSLEGAERAQALLLRATALDALNRRDDVRATLDAAVAATPDVRDVSSGAISFMIGRGRWRDAFEIARAARARLQLPAQWQVYFSLWAAHAARLANIRDDGGATEALATIARRAGPSPSWTQRLAQRAVGTIDRAAILAAAQTPGQRAEAYFYEALRDMGGPERPRAIEALRAVLATDMLRFLEYDMAWELLAHEPGASGAPAAAAAQPANAPTAR